jgi:GNAT superfamily N-acetyltransferase
VTACQDEWDGPRSARDYELSQATELVDVVLLNSVPRYGREFAHVHRAGNLENILVIKSRGQLVHVTAMFVATVKLGAAQIRVAGLNGVCTHPDFRGRGLGSRMMLYCLERMRALGVHVGLLWTPIPDWYRKFGWERAGIEDGFFLDRGNIPLLPDPAAFAIREARTTDQASLLELHNRALGGGRTPEVQQILLEAKQPLTLMALDGAEPLAYVQLEPTRRRIREHGGATEAVAALVRAAFERLDNPALSTTARDSTGAPVLDASLRLTTPPCESGLSGFLAARGVPRDRSYLGMLRVVDVRGLLAEVGHAGSCTVADEDAVTLTLGGQTATFDRRTLAKQLFGPVRPSEWGKGILPLPLYVWPWDRV